jgi:MIP family channel proteins
MTSSPVFRRKLIAEFIGTFVFVLVGAGSALGTTALVGPGSASSLLIAALANGLGLAVAVSATMAISGGVLNPAVTIGLFIGNKLPAKDVLPYVLVELGGAITAGLALVATFPAALGNAAGWGAPSLGGGLNVGQGVLLEALLTFVLVTAVYGTAVDSRAPHIGGLGIGLAVVADVLVAGPLTGAAMNPARAMGPMLAALVAGQGFPGYWYIYWIGPILGAIAAGGVYAYFLESEK